MTPIVVDFETFFAPGYTLSSMTTEAYVRDERFETILCGIKIAGEDAYWVDRDDVPAALRELKLHRHAMISHHAHFDGLIANHHYGIRPKLHIDTLSMARGLYGSKAGNSLGALAKRHNLPAKGDDTKWAFGMRRDDFTSTQLAKYGAYCCNDCDIEYGLACLFTPQYSIREMRVIDTVVRAFTEPILLLRADTLTGYVKRLRREKLSLLMEAGIQLADVMSNEKFAMALENLGVEPPQKFNAKGKLTWAFSKQDAHFMALAEDPDERVQALMAARLKNKSTINETRAQRMIEMASRGPACIYYNFSGAGQTHRLSGGDKMNWQNFTRGSELRAAVEAPPGYLVVVGDSSNIESRTLDYLAGEEHMMEAYRRYDAGRGPDIYCVMAEMLYGRKIIKDLNKVERQMGKVVKLGLGYGMGWEKFIHAAKAQAKLNVTPEFAQEAVNIYRQGHRRVMRLHRRGESMLNAIANGMVGVPMDDRGIVVTHEEGLMLPSGLLIKYHDLQSTPGMNGRRDWTYWDGKQRVHIYGGKVVENVIQALARIIVFYQCLLVPSPLRMSSHDEGVWCVPKAEAPELKLQIESALRTPLSWCRDLPLNCEVGFHKNYRDAKA